MKEKLTVDQAMLSINRDFLIERKADVRVLRKKEALLDNCGCKSCMGLYAMAVRTFLNKWRMPERCEEVTPIKYE